jgi:DNA-binding CsgD family transcriptional regulator
LKGARNVATLKDMSVAELFERASARLRRRVPFDAAVWMATDPVTALPTAPTRTENMERFGGVVACARMWEGEFLSEDVNTYRELTRAERPAASLGEVTDGRPERSARYREFLRPIGFGDELRAALRVDGCTWACVTLLRDRDTFSRDEVELVAGLSAPLAEAVREQARPVVGGHGVRGPGVMIFGAGGELASVNDDALAWLDELGGGMPLMVISTVARGDGARARVRAASGRWLVCHASRLRGTEGTVLVIEPAAASEIIPIIAEAYELSLRERQIVQLIARGTRTAEIAGRLHLSPHTVRDYVKALFEKVGVSSRGELVAKLFAEHVAPIHFSAGSRA